ncbi:hypothetical protein JXA40_00035 [bacterium]|nr:hypothetical protein [candidate division CSSED10-310 bacterium]
MSEERKNCSICAWRQTCQLKFSPGRDGVPIFYCREFTLDITLSQPHRESGQAGEKDVKQEKRYFSFPDKKKQSGTEAS